MDQYFSTRKVADLLDVNIITVRRWILKGLLPAIKIEKALRVSKTDLDKFIEERKVKA